MIYAVTQSMENYNVTLNGVTVGVYDTYRNNPELLALLLIATPVGYDYEGNKPPAERICQLNNDGIFEESLWHQIGDNKIVDYLRWLDPLEFYEEMSTASIDEINTIPFVDKILGGNGDLFLTNVGARAAAWAINFRGRRKTKGKQIQVAFQGIKVEEKLKEFHNAMKEEFGYGG